MKELSLNILDIAQNSIRAGAAHVEIALVDRENRRTLTVADDGCGMDAALLARVTDPFATTRTTRPVGLGLPLLQLSAEQAGGALAIESRRIDAEASGQGEPAFAAGSGYGTRVTATFDPANIDCVPLGDLAATMVTLVQGSPDIDFSLTLSLSGMPEPFVLDTAEMRQLLGDEVPLCAPEVLRWVGESVEEALSRTMDTEIP